MLLEMRVLLTPILLFSVMNVNYYSFWGEEEPCLAVCSNVVSSCVPAEEGKDSTIGINTVASECLNLILILQF